MNEQTEKAICRVVVKCHKKYIYLLTFTLMVHILYYPYPEKYNVNVLGQGTKDLMNGLTKWPW